MVRVGAEFSSASLPLFKPPLTIQPMNKQPDSDIPLHANQRFGVGCAKPPQTSSRLSPAAHDSTYTHFPHTTSRAHDSSPPRLAGSNPTLLLAPTPPPILSPLALTCSPLASSSPASPAPPLPPSNPRPTAPSAVFRPPRVPLTRRRMSAILLTPNGSTNSLASTCRLRRRRPTSG
jgi:hypothetical protein